MKVVPVLDILEGEVVRGVAGQRADYRRIVSRLTSSAEPIDVANAIRDSFGLNEIYIADLDGILWHRPNLAIYRRLNSAGFQLLVDAGIRDPIEAKILREAGVIRLIVGLETCRTPDDLACITENDFDVTFSLDLLHGMPRRREDASGWSDEPIEIIRQAVNANVCTILPLDLSDVGTGTGGSTDALCRCCRDTFPSVRLIAGGGVRGRDDLNRLNELGVDAVLVASSLHDGRLNRDDMVIDPSHSSFAG